MKTELTAVEKKELIPNIEKVLKTGKDWDSLKLHHPAGAIIDAVLEIKGMKKGESDEYSGGSEGFDCNGWAWDWWQQFEYKGKQYTLSGSGYHGGHSFTVAD